MIIALGSDHRGLAHKELILAALGRQGHETVDFGCHQGAPADYPDAALPVAEQVAGGRAQFGILICGSGIGMSIAANKVRGVRAALCATESQARATRQHNDSNVLCLSGDAMDPPTALVLSLVWLETAFEGGRHARRIAKITEYEDLHLIQEGKDV